MIDTNLRNKYDLYNKVIPIIKGSNKDKTKEKENNSFNTYSYLFISIYRCVFLL